MIIGLIASGFIMGSQDLKIKKLKRKLKSKE